MLQLIWTESDNKSKAWKVVRSSKMFRHKNVLLAESIFGYAELFNTPRAPKKQINIYIYVSQEC